MKTDHETSKLKYMQIKHIIRAKQMTSEDLDGLVIDLALKHATNVNNNGITTQVNFILNHMKADDLIKHLSTSMNIYKDTTADIDSKIKKLISENKKHWFIPKEGEND